MFRQNAMPMVSFDARLSASGFVIPNRFVALFLDEHVNIIDLQTLKLLEGPLQAE